jgi:acyl-CoA reductase-like NAD-dependent aldehyde dehydrogenase
MKMIINGKDVDAKDGKVIHVINPATHEEIDTVPAAAEEDLELALETARKGTKIWRKVPLYKRSEILRNYAKLLREHIDDFAVTMSAESGKLLKDCKGELDFSAVVFEAYAEKGMTYGGQTLPKDSDYRVDGDIIMTLRQPLGVIVDVIPFNYPAELYADKVAPALITGNSVIIKPSSDTPLTNILMTKLLHEAGVPVEAAQIVTGSGSKVGNYLASSPMIDGYSLTGSVGVGITSMENCAKNLTHCFLELGGNDPIIVFEDADLDQAVEETLGGRASNAGQTCCGTKRMIVQNSIKEAYTQKLVEALKKLKIGDPMDDATDMGPLINEKAAQDCEEQVKLTVNQGAKCVYGGKSFDKTFFEPTVLADVTLDMDIATSLEVFGPVFPIIGFDTVEEAIAIANAAPYGLSSGVLTKDLSTAFKVATEIEAGTCVVNGSGNYRSACLAFGGVKMTGIGREGTSESLDEYTVTKNIALKGLLK